MMCGTGGQFAPRRSAIAVLMLPAASPLSMAICTGSPAETFCVRLLSIPQQRHAPETASGPANPPHDKRPSHERTMPPATIASIPSAIRRSKFSRKTNHAMSAVNTPSRLSRREAPDAGVRVRPIMSINGASTPPKLIAPRSHGTSRRASALSRTAAVERRPRTQTRTNPVPEPR